MNPSTEENTYIHETSDFGVRIAPLQSASEWQGMTGYQIVNKRTGVIEGEVTVEFSALRTIREMQNALDDALAGDDAPEPEGMNIEDFMKFLQENQD